MLVVVRAVEKRLFFKKGDVKRLLWRWLLSERKVQECAGKLRGRKEGGSWKHMSEARGGRMSFKRGVQQGHSSSVVAIPQLYVACRWAFFFSFLFLPIEACVFSFLSFHQYQLLSWYCWCECTNSQPCKRKRGKTKNKKKDHWSFFLCEWQWGNVKHKARLDKSVLCFAVVDR